MGFKIKLPKINIKAFTKTLSKGVKGITSVVGSIANNPIAQMVAGVIPGGSAILATVKTASSAANGLAGKAQKLVSGLPKVPGMTTLVNASPQIGARTTPSKVRVKSEGGPRLNQINKPARVSAPALDIMPVLVGVK